MSQVQELLHLDRDLQQARGRMWEVVSSWPEYSLGLTPWVGEARSASSSCIDFGEAMPTSRTSPTGAQSEGMSLAEDHEPAAAYGGRAAMRWAERLADEDRVAVSSFLLDVYGLSARGETQRAVDAILRFFDRALSGREIPKCNDALERLDAKRLDASMMISVLCITEGLSQACPARETFYGAALRALASSRGHEAAERLLVKHR